MKKPIIAIDIDDVIFPFVNGIATYHNELKGTVLTEDDFFSFDLWDVWGSTEQEAIEIVENFMQSDYMHLVPLAGAKESLERLARDFRIVLITARNGAFSDNTTRWLQYHLSDIFHEVIFAGNHYDGRGYRTKGEICKELGAVLIIDDSPRNILSAAQQNIDGILFGEKAWSVMDELPATLVKSCKDWDQAEEYIYGEWRSKQLS